jgi:hypothetical protein
MTLARRLLMAVLGDHFQMSGDNLYASDGTLIGACLPRTLAAARPHIAHWTICDTGLMAPS